MKRENPGGVSTFMFWVYVGVCYLLLAALGKLFEWRYGRYEKFEIKK